MLGGKFVIAIKDEGTNKGVLRDRFIFQRYTNKLKTALVHEIATLRQHSNRGLVGLAEICGFRLFSTHVIQAYLQSAEKLMGDVHIKPTGEFELIQDKLFKLLKPVYGVTNSRDYRGSTINNHMMYNLNMKETTGDGAFFFKCILSETE